MGAGGGERTGKRGKNLRWKKEGKGGKPYSLPHCPDKVETVEISENSVSCCGPWVHKKRKGISSLHQHTGGFSFGL